jgi:protocatechuate 3,4-dioxygenase alpha subunit
MSMMPTPSQTVGPFFAIGLPDAGTELVAPDDPDVVRIVGTIYDGEGEVVPDAMVEVWQANRSGRYAHPEDTRDELALEEGFLGFGRCGTDAGGGFEFVTVKPGVVPGRNGAMQAPHIEVSVFARGILKRMATRIYFPDEPDANEADPVLTSIEDPDERATLVAREGDGALRFDIHLQGDRQTAFFAV